MDQNEYYNRVEDILQNPPYEASNKNPLNKFISSVSSSIKECKNLISNFQKRALTVSNPILPRMYCLPKIHKEGKQMRPIIPCINSPASLLSKWLVNEFQKLEFPSTFSVKDRYQFIDFTKNIILEPDEILVSFDVVSLYPNVPMKESKEIIENWLNSLHLNQDIVKEFMILFNLCISQNSFQFKDNIYNQLEGTPMGNPLSCFIANIFMSEFETKAKQVMHYFPRVWLRYDMFAVFDKNQNIIDFVNELNSYYPTIKFTFEF